MENGGDLVSRTFSPLRLGSFLSTSWSDAFSPFPFLTARELFPGGVMSLSLPPCVSP